jgi:hypothetical protein
MNTTAVPFTILKPAAFGNCGYVFDRCASGAAALGTQIASTVPISLQVWPCGVRVGVPERQDHRVLPRFGLDTSLGIAQLQEGHI